MVLIICLIPVATVADKCVPNKPIHRDHSQSQLFPQVCQHRLLVVRIVNLLCHGQAFLRMFPLAPLVLWIGGRKISVERAFPHGVECVVTGRPARRVMALKRVTRVIDEESVAALEVCSYDIVSTVLLIQISLQIH
jgi:hypothetical protein